MARRTRDGLEVDAYLGGLGEEAKSMAVPPHREMSRFGFLVYHADVPFWGGSRRLNLAAVGGMGALSDIPSDPFAQGGSGGI